jgi:hypothetical protein
LNISKCFSGGRSICSHVPNWISQMPLDFTYIEHDPLNNFFFEFSSPCCAWVYENTLVHDMDAYNQQNTQHFFSYHGNRELYTSLSYT